MSHLNALSRSRLPLGFALITLLLSGCGRRHETTTTLRVSGAWALYPLMVRWGEAYHQAHPSVRIDVAAGGAGKGIADTLAGLADLGMVSREVTQEEGARGAVCLPVARDATLLIMNAANPSAGPIQARGFTRETSQALWLKEQPLYWGQFAGDGSQARVQVFTRSDSCGAAETWAKYLGGRQQDLAGIGVYGDPGIAEAVRKDLHAVAYCNLNYAYDARSGLPVLGLRVIPIDVNGDGRIQPQEDLGTKAKAIAAIRNGVLPSPPARDLGLVAKQRFQGPAAAFVAWILTDGQKLVDPTGYIEISPRQLQAARASLGQ